MRKILFMLLFITMALSQSTPFNYGGWYNGALYVPNELYTAGIVIADENSLASESLNEPDFATTLKWTGAEDFTEDVGVAFDYSHSGGTGSLTQLQANLAIVGVGDKWYRFSYIISNETSFAGSMTITTGFASSAVSLSFIDGIHVVYFKSKSSPVDFVLSVTSTVGSFTIDDVTLKEITGGDVTAFGNILGYGTLGLGVGTTINEFSTDVLLAGDSDDAVPTEKAVKAYADAIGAAGTDNQKIDALTTSGNNIEISLEDDGEATKTLDISGITAIADNTTHSGSDGKDHSDVVDNSTHSIGSGADHSDVVDNSSHSGGDGADHSLKLNDIANPDGDASFNMTTKQLRFLYTAPITGDGAFEIEGSGAFDGDLLHIHQHTGNPSAGTHLVHLEAEDVDVIPFSIIGAHPTTDIILSNGGGINEFSIDETLAGDSDNAVPTEQAVKAYVDGKAHVTGEISNVVEDSTPELGGDLDLLTYEILLDSEPDANVTASGIKVELTAGEVLAFGDVCYQNADGEIYLADATDATKMPGMFMALEAGTDGNPCEFLMMGVVRDDTWTWTVGGIIYATITGTTTNTLSQTAPTEVGEQVQVIGVATHADRMTFTPSLVLVEI